MGGGLLTPCFLATPAIGSRSALRTIHDLLVRAGIAVPVRRRGGIAHHCQRATPPLRRDRSPPRLQRHYPFMLQAATPTLGLHYFPLERRNIPLRPVRGTGTVAATPRRRCEYLVPFLFAPAPPRAAMGTVNFLNDQRPFKTSWRLSWHCIAVSR